MEGIAAKVAAGSILLIGIYLIVTNPNGTKASVNSISAGGVDFVKALQGR